jgi:alpha-D-xyloside xylohydrolase
MLVRDGSVIPHAKVAQSTDKIDWSKLDFKVYKADKKKAQGFVFKPNDDKLTIVTK